MGSPRAAEGRLAAPAWSLATVGFAGCDNARMPIATRFTEMFGCRHPLQQAGIGGVTTPDLAIAVARAGGLGMLTGTVGNEALSVQIDALPADASIGVNFLVPFLDRSALDEAASRSPYVEFFWGEPDADVVEIVHAGGARAGWQVGSADEARAARDVGCELIVAQGIEAGGHVRGTVGLLPLMNEVRAAVDLPIVAAGGIGTGKDVAAALVAGADAVRVGTRFMAAAESIAHPEYIEALISAGADDTILTTAFGDGWPDAPHRVLKSAIAAGEALGDAQSWAPDWPTATAVGAVEARALYAGQSVGAVRSRQPAAAILAELVEEAERLLSPTA
jgi:nitronate monooxygenase